MARHLMLALTNPVAGRDAEFNRWYDEVAYPTYRSLPGFTPLGRFRAVDIPDVFPFQMKNEFEYLSLYYFEADDAGAFMEEIKAAFAHRPEYSFSDAVDRSRFFEPIFVALGEVNFAPIDRYEMLKR